jgi:hypothetical protein
MRRPAGRDLDQGFEIARVPTTETTAELQRRSQIRQVARSNLAALVCEEFGLDPAASAHGPAALRRAGVLFRYLLDVLDLTSSLRPGPSPASTESPAPNPHRSTPDPSNRSCTCTWCSAGSSSHNPPRRPSQSPQEPIHPGLDGECPVCKRHYRLNRAGGLRLHKQWRAGKTGEPFRSDEDCPASGHLSVR